MLKLDINMAIKDRDGKVYKLRGPNPLLVQQQEWDKSKINFYNLKGTRNEVVVSDERNPVEAFKDNVIDIGKELKLESKEVHTKTIEPKKFFEEIREVPKERPTVVKMPEPVKLVVDDKMARILKERGVEYHCCPAIGRKSHIDDLYGNGYSTVEYGEKFVFDAVIIDESDLELQFWCVKPVTAQSVIHKKHKQGGERWWRITNVDSKTGGWLARAVTSDSNPDFS